MLGIKKNRSPGTPLTMQSIGSPKYCLAVNIPEKRMKRITVTCKQNEGSFMPGVEFKKFPETLPYNGA